MESMLMIYHYASIVPLPDFFVLCSTYSRKRKITNKSKFLITTSTLENDSLAQNLKKVFPLGQNRINTHWLAKSYINCSEYL